MEQREEPAPKPNPSDPQTPFSAAEITASFIRAKIGHAVFIPASKQQQARPANIRLRGVTAGVSYDRVEDGRQFGDIDRAHQGGVIVDANLDNMIHAPEAAATCQGRSCDTIMRKEMKLGRIA